MAEGAVGTQTAGAGALRRLVDQQAAVAALGRDALAGIGVEQLLARAAQATAAGLETELVGVLLVDPAGEALICRGNVGWRPELIRPVPLEGESQLACTHRTGEAIVLGDLASDSRFAGSRHLTEHGIVSAISVPIAAADRRFGVIAAHARAEGSFEDDDLLFLDGVANVVAAALVREEAERVRARSLDYAHRLQRVAALLGSVVRRSDVLRIVIDAGFDACGAASALVALDVGDGEVEIAAERGYGDTVNGWSRFAAVEAVPVGRAMRSGRGVYCASRAERNALFPAMTQRGPAETHAVAAVPLSVGGEVAGALVLSFGADHPFEADERLFLETLAAQAGQALERARLFELHEGQAAMARTLAATLAVERERLEEILNQMPVPALIRDASPERRVVLANERARELLGSDLLETLGPPASGHAGRHDAKRIPIARAIRDGETIRNEELTIERSDGSRLIVLISASPIRDAEGQIVAGIATFHDVTAEREAEVEARRRADAAAALEFVADGICLVDNDGAVRLWNDAARRITGLASEAVVGRPLAEAIPQWAELEARVPPARSGATPRPLTLPIDLEGGECWLSVSAVRFHGGAVYAFRDVSEEHALDSMKRDFIATVSHELRTPLSAVYGAAATLRSRSSLGPEDREQFLVMIEEQSERLSRIVNEILTASRLDSGEVVVELTGVDAAALAREVVAVAQRGAPTGFRIDVLAADGLPHVLADPDRLRQVLGNLVENAVKYSGDGDLVEVELSPAGRWVRFAVSDRGIGIPAAEQERIFEKFYRVDPAMSSGVSGTGLGLYIVSELVARMHGTIRVESSRGGGSTFVVELPAA